MLSRVANNLFWMDRYMERSYGLLNLIKANYNASLDSATTSSWQGIINSYLGSDEVNINYDESISIIDFIIFDTNNNNTLINMITNARENARSVQEHISREIWLSINKYFLDISNDDFYKSFRKKDPIEFTWSLIGDHNLHNALSAIAAAQHVGVSVGISCDALKNFKGVKRRMEVIFANQNVILYEDFAHHPTAIESTLRGLRESAPRDFILTVIEPASHTMRSGYHKETLSKSSQTADHVLWYKPKSISWDMTIIENDKAEIIPDLETLKKNILRRIEKEKKKIRVVVMSNSGFSGLCKDLVTVLKDS